jgi:hypothetical protein
MFHIDFIHNSHNTNDTQPCDLKQGSSCAETNDLCTVIVSSNLLMIDSLLKDSYGSFDHSKLSCESPNTRIRKNHTCPVRGLGTADPLAGKICVHLKVCTSSSHMSAKNVCMRCPEKYKIYKSEWGFFKKKLAQLGQRKNPESASHFFRACVENHPIVVRNGARLPPIQRPGRVIEEFVLNAGREGIVRVPVCVRGRGKAIDSVTNNQRDTVSV